MTTTLLLAFSLAAGVAHAQQTAPAPRPATAQVDARFANWLGCWRLEDDLAGTGARLCIQPDTPGVRLDTVVARINSATELLRTDGVARPITDSECKGSERAEWSRDGQRVFRYTDVTCGAEPARKVTSIAFLMSGPSWINVQFVEGGPNKTVRVQRYRRALDQKLADGSLAMQVAGSATRALTEADTLWTVDDVIEASGKVPAEAVQAAVAEAKGRFEINKKTLVAMADAGVAENVIDLMIGLAYPERFVVQRRGSGMASAPVGISMGGGYYDPFMSPIMFGGAYDDCYGYGYRSYYSSCGYYSPYSNYYPYNGYGYYYPNSGGWVVVDNGTGTGTGTPAAEGRVVNGRGYTQVRPRDNEPAPVRTSGNGNGSSAGWSGSNTGSSGVSSQGYSGGSSGSSGSSGDSGARTAVPRPPGGGDF